MLKQEIIDVMYDIFSSAFHPDEWTRLINIFEIRLSGVICDVERCEEFCVYRCKVLDYNVDKRFYPLIVARTFDDAVEVARTLFERPDLEVTLEGVVEVKVVTHVAL